LSLEDDLFAQRLRRTAEIEALGFRAYGQRFDASHTIPQILADYSAKTAEELADKPRVQIAGRIQTVRRMGKADKARFMNIAQGSLEECRYYLILAQDLNYGNSGELMLQLEEVSRMPSVYSKAILTSVF
jgi:lysyl-tRNA synthetase class II